MDRLTHDEIRAAVRNRYGTIAETRGVPAATARAPAAGVQQASRVAEATPQQRLIQKPMPMATPQRTRALCRQGANLGLGCGNPIALASLRPGETVLDLGSGAGFDCFLAARAVGETGRVIGVDMTHEMLRKARANADKGGCHACRVSARRN